MEEKRTKILLYSLLSYTIGGFLIAVGIMAKVLLATIFFYIIGMLMMIASMLCLYNNYKMTKEIKLYAYLYGIGIFLSLVFTCICIAQIFNI